MTFDFSVRFADNQHQLFNFSKEHIESNEQIHMQQRATNDINYLL